MFCFILEKLKSPSLPVYEVLQALTVYGSADTCETGRLLRGVAEEVITLHVFTLQTSKPLVLRWLQSLIRDNSPEMSH